MFVMSTLQDFNQWWYQVSGSQSKHALNRAQHLAPTTISSAERRYGIIWPKVSVHFLLCQTERENDSYLMQRHIKAFWNIKLVSRYSKWAMEIPNVWILSVSTGETHTSKRAFFSHAKQNVKWVIFDTMAYQRLLKYQINFPVFKVSEP